MPRRPCAPPGNRSLVRVVVDTNVLVSRYLTPHGPPAQVFDQWERGAFEVPVSELVLAEYRRALNYEKLRQHQRGMRTLGTALYTAIGYPASSGDRTIIPYLLKRFGRTRAHKADAKWPSHISTLNSETGLRKSRHGAYGSTRFWAGSD